MSIRRGWIRALGCCWFLALATTGCNTTGSAPIESRTHVDDWGGDIDDDSPITLEQIQQQEMLHQRAQFELRAGPTFPFDLFDPGGDPLTDISFVIGGKGSIEVAKNLYFSISADWSNLEVEEESSPAQREPIQNIEDYDRVSVLGGMDYDIPLGDTPDSLLLRLGFGIGAAIILPDSVDSAQEVQEIYQVLFRPAIGLRWPIADNWLLFGEAYYDIVPQRDIETTQDLTIGGNDDAIFGSGSLIFGVSFVW